MRDRRCATFILLAAAVALIVTGILVKEPADVAQKAVNICMECVGIG